MGVIMGTYKPLIFKIAMEPFEFELIHRLNYRTFVEEIPQHSANREKRLVDRFHEENTYIICMSGEELVGMVALRGQRPFSLDFKLDNLDSYVPANSKPVEIRLLAIEPRYRKPSVILGIMQRGVEVARAHGYDIALISGITRQIRLYQHLGFQPFGPLVGTPEAMFQPMYLTWDAFEAQVGALLDRSDRFQEPANFLPGPVAISKKVHEAFVQTPVSHRSANFSIMLEEIKAALRSLTGASEVVVLQGSGTLANDVIGAQLSFSEQPGVVLANGEFGERLCDHARRFGLDHVIYNAGWGRALNLGEIDRLLMLRPQTRWLWAVHCETSTGVLNDLEALKTLSQLHHLKLCVDCVSSIGALNVNLSGVQFAAGTSGKAIGALPGLSMVFIGGDVVPRGRLPCYLDLAGYLHSGVPFTMSSNLLAALRVALTMLGAERYSAIANAAHRLRNQLDSYKIDVVAPRLISAPHVVTIPLPEQVDSSTLAGKLASRGILVAHASEYLRRRNCIQICLMGEFTTAAIDRVAATLAGEVRDAHACVYRKPKSEHNGDEARQGLLNCHATILPGHPH